MRNKCWSISVDYFNLTCIEQQLRVNKGSESLTFREHFENMSR